MVDRAAAAAAELGADAELLDGPAMRERGFPSTFTRGLFERCGGLLNPARYTRGLREAAIASGVRVHERSGVRALDLGSTITAHTDRGHVRADVAVLATNAFTGELDLSVPNVARLAVQLFATEPLTESQRERIAWRGAGIYTAHEILESYRLTAGGRIVGGSKHIRYCYDNRPAPDVDLATSQRIERAFRQRFPALDDVRIEHHWGGPIAIALDFLPRIGRRRNLLYAHGFAGHGLAQASYVGKLLVDLLHGRDNLATPLVTRRAVPLPPEPLRWLVARALTGLFERIDAKTDRLLV
jgi:glycine/D-amino acid oxidase-like deaminating enzyme